MIHTRDFGFTLLQFMHQRLLENQVLLYLETMYSVVAKLDVNSGSSVPNNSKQVNHPRDTVEILPQQRFECSGSHSYGLLEKLRVKINFEADIVS